MGELFVRDEAGDFRSKLEHRRAGRDIKRSRIGIAPSEIRGLFREHDGAQVSAGGIENPNSGLARHVEISGGIDAHAIGIARAIQLSEEAAIADTAVARDVPDANFFALAVIHVELAAVG